MMETFVQLIFVVALLSYCLKAALSNKPLMIVGYGLALSVISFGIYPIVLNQPMNILAQLMSDRSLVENFALLTTAESIAGIILSIHLIDNYFLPKAKRTRLAKCLKLIPGILVFFAVGYFELLFFKWRVGEDFLLSALLFFVLILIVVVSMSFLLRFLVEGESLKLEVKIILNLAILVLGLLVSSSIADYNVSHAHNPIDWKALISLTVGSTFIIGLGYFLHKIDFTHKLSNILKWNK